MKPVDADYYTILELKPGSSIEEVKSQYRRLAKRYHPDLNNNDVQYQEKLLRVNAAYAFLSDAARKAAYDARPQPAVVSAPSMPKPPPAVNRPQPSVTATGYHTPATRHPLTAISDIRMTRSGWLGATAIGVLILLGLGLSIDSGDQGHVGSVVNIPAAVSADHPAVTSGDKSEPDPVPPSMSSSPGPAVTFPAAPGSVPTLLPHRRLSAGQFRTDYMGAEHLDNIAGAQNPASTRNTPLLPQYRAILPKVDGLINHGATVYVSNENGARDQPRLKNAARNALLAQLGADLHDLKATRNRIKPAIIQFSQQHTAEAKPRETEPSTTEVRTLTQQRQSVRDDLQALSATPAHAAAPVSPPQMSTASAAAPILVKPADRQVAKPKTTEPAAPSFITWGK